MTPQLTLMYIETEIPAGMTCDDYKRAHQPLRPRRKLLQRLRRRR